jgi:Uma2 family endonuclease
MAMPVTLPERSIWTADDLAELSHDGTRYEVLHGELVVSALPVPTHQRVAMKLAVLFETAAPMAPCTVFAPAEIHVSRTTVLEPDVAVYAGVDIVQRDWRTMPVPCLVIEVLSPSTRSHDRHRKRPEYLRHGIAHVWTVDPDARVIERWSAASEFPVVERDDFEVRLTSAHAEVRVSLAAVFGSAQASRVREGPQA